MTGSGGVTRATPNTATRRYSPASPTARPSRGRERRPSTPSSSPAMSCPSCRSLACSLSRSRWPSLTPPTRTSPLRSTNSPHHGWHCSLRPGVSARGAGVLARSRKPGSRPVAPARARARAARTNIEAAVQRALNEPTSQRAGLRTRQATGVRASLGRLADGALSLEAFLEDGVSPAPSEARALADQFDAALAQLVRAAQDHRAPGPLPPLP